MATYLIAPYPIMMDVVVTAEGDVLIIEIQAKDQPAMQEVLDNPELHIWNIQQLGYRYEPDRSWLANVRAWTRVERDRQSGLYEGLKILALRFQEGITPEAQAAVRQLARGNYHAAVQPESTAQTVRLKPHQFCIECSAYRSDGEEFEAGICFYCSLMCKHDYRYREGEINGTNVVGDFCDKCGRPDPALVLAQDADT